LATLSDEELSEDLGLKPLQVKKIRQKLAEHATFVPSQCSLTEDVRRQKNSSNKTLHFKHCASETVPRPCLSASANAPSSFSRSATGSFLPNNFNAMRYFESPTDAPVEL